MTREEIKRNFEFRAWKKEIMSDFPIITDIYVDEDFEEDWNKYTSTFFTNADISLSKIKNMYPNWELKNFVEYLMDNEGEIFKIFTLHEVFDTDDEASINNFEKGLSENTWEFHRDLSKRTEVPPFMKLKKIPSISKFRLVE
jgi:hypothetical protein